MLFSCGPVIHYSVHQGCCHLMLTCCFPKHQKQSRGNFHTRLFPLSVTVYGVHWLYQLQSTLLPSSCATGLGGEVACHRDISRGTSSLCSPSSAISFSRVERPDARVKATRSKDEAGLRLAQILKALFTQEAFHYHDGRTVGSSTP